MDGRVTAILHAVQSGDVRASEELLPLVYAELRALADRRMARESAGHTLQATALVHEAYLKLLGPGGENDRRWQDQGHFFAAAAEAMRRILIDHARAKRADKRGGNRGRELLGDPLAEPAAADEDLPAIDEALSRFEAQDPQKAELVKLRFFAGLTLDQAARVLGISAATADRHWAYARAWLFDDLKKSGDPDGT
jgi:RNA polymerase sigma factor (TIGR02999 family)